MKKIVMSLALLMSMWMSIAPSFASGWEMISNATYNPYDNGLSLDILKNAAKNSSIKKILEDNYKMIAQNSVYENYEYNSTHYISKQISYTLFIPDRLMSKVRSISVEIKNNYMDYATPFYDIETKQSVIPVEIIIDTKSFDGESVTWTIVLTREQFEVTNELGNTFQLQAYITLTDGSILPYSQIWYIYMYGSGIEGVKFDFTNAFYSANQKIWYADTTRLLRNAFDKLETKTNSLKDYLVILEKVSQKATSLSEQYTALGDEIAGKVTDDESFQENVEIYWRNMMKVNVLNDAMWQIRTEIETRKSADIIDELFSDY